MKLIFVRHGDPDYVNDSLTERGFKEAEILKQRLSKLHIDEFYCSPMGRAVKTSEPTLELMNRKAEILPWLKEFHGTVIDQRTNEQRKIWDLMPSVWATDEAMCHRDKWLESPMAKAGNIGEFYKDVIDNFDKFLKEHGYKKDNGYFKTLRENGDTVLFFCHYGVTSILLSYLLGISPFILVQNFIAFPSSVTTLQTEEREKGVTIFRVREFGDLSHLYAADEPPSHSGEYCELFSNEDERH